MAQLYINNAATTLNGSITAAATSITVTDGSVFPSPTGADYFLATLYNSSNETWEVVTCTARSSNVLTVTRATEGSALAFNDGDAIYLALTAATIAKIIMTDDTGFLDTDVYLNDDIYIYFGDGGDLQIYHDGSNSYIDDWGTGSLKIRSNSGMVLASSTDENMAVLTPNGAVTLYFNNAAKIATTTNGVDITGVMNIASASTVAVLPTPSTGMVARVSDATSPAIGSTVTGGGAAAALVWYNGSNWTVIGI